MTPPRPGFPFDPSQVPDPLGPEVAPELTARVRAQVGSLVERCTDPAVERETMDRIVARHDGGGDVPRLQAFTARDGSRILVRAGRMLVDAGQLARWQRQGRSLPPGFAVVGRGEGTGDGRDDGDGTVELGLTGPAGRGPGAVHEAVARLREAGLQPSPQWVATAACPVGKKGDAGPVPVPAPHAAFPSPRPVHGPFPTPRDVFVGHARPSGHGRAPAGGSRHGGGPPVGIVDTGITDQTRQDGWLAGIPRPRGSVDPLDAIPPGGDGYLDLAAGHGTFVAGVVEQVAPLADVRVHRALDSDGIGPEEEICRTMLRAVRDGQQILCLSFGMSTDDGVPPRRMAATIEEIGALAEERGVQVLLVAAAGNSGDERPCWPAAFSRGADSFLREGAAGGVKVVAVAGLAPGLEPAAWATRGSWVDVSTVAQGICSPYVTGTEYPCPQNPRPDTFGADPWALWSGSSFAAPQVVGAVVRLCRERGLAPHDALRRLMERGVPVDGFGRALQVLPGH